MDKKAQVVIISLWILIILTILAISIGHRISLALRLSLYQRDRLKAYYLAKAGVNKAFSELEKDKNNYDSLMETWSTGMDDKNNPIFENIEIEKESGETFTVGHRESDVKYICMEDEERKININRIDDLGKQQLIELFIFKEVGEDEAKDLADTIIDWIDDNDTDNKRNKEDKIFKNRPLKVTEELVAILEYFYQTKGEPKFQEKAQEIYNKIKDLITVYGKNYRVNVNTVSEDVLRILGRAIAQNILSEGILDRRKFGDSVIGKIISLREDKKFFEKINDINIPVTGEEERSVLGSLKTQYLSVKSENFRIRVTGKVKNITKNIIATYDRQKNRIVYWHEN